jgi:hypothetical protein
MAAVLSHEHRSPARTARPGNYLGLTAKAVDDKSPLRSARPRMADAGRTVVPLEPKLVRATRSIGLS